MCRPGQKRLPLYPEGRGELGFAGDHDPRPGRNLCLGEQLRIPLAQDGQGNEFVPVFTDSPEFSRAFGKKPEIRPAIVEYSKLIPTMTGKKGLIVNPAGLKLAFSLQDLAGMENAIAAAAKKAEEKKAEKKAEEKAEEKTEKKTGDI